MITGEILNNILKSSAFSRDEIYSIQTNSKEIKDGDVFLGIQGERFDGGKFAESAIQQGAKAVIIHPQNKTIELEEKNKSVDFFYDENPLLIFQNIATAKIEQLKKTGCMVIAITGSNGKTTTKEMLNHLLKSESSDVFCTQGNFNNHVGVPITILQAPLDTKYLILEIGTNHFGEIAMLAKIGNPDMGMITSIGDSHLEFLIDREGVLREKSALFDHIECRGNGTLVCPEEDAYLQKIHYENLKRVSLNKKIKNKYLIGDHNFRNFSLAFEIAIDLFPTKENELLKACENFIPKENRSSWIKFQGRDVFLDAYNANPSSMSASLEGFSNSIKNSEEALVILGDMNELGVNGPDFHEEIGKQLNVLNINKAVFVGSFSKHYSKEFKKEFETYSHVNEISAETRNDWFASYSKIFIKGSRSLQLESILDIT